MTKKPVKNVAASVHQRLLNVARESNRSFNDLVVYYALERFLYRLSQSKHAGRYVLKGALMLFVWELPVTRLTRDIDLLGRTSNDLEGIRAIMAEICALEVDDDGVVFDPTTVTTARITEDADYQGIRVTFRGRLGSTPIAMQIDIGFSDVITPAPASITYPTILDYPAPKLKGYNRETVVAEKFEAMVKLGELNSRMKDFFDLWMLSETFDFDGGKLVKAVRATFKRRETPIDPEAVCFSEAFAQGPTKVAQWTAFVRRSRLTDSPPELPEIVSHISKFLQPIAQAAASNSAFNKKWKAGGPWREHA